MREARWLVVAVGCAWIGAWPAVALPEDDVLAIRRAGDAYVSAWLANDPAAVLATLADDAVLLPAHGRPAVVGKPAITAFWWPPGPPATVDAFISTADEIGGEGDLGWARGAFELRFTYGGRSTTQHGTYLMLFRRRADGAWRITHRMWDDAPR